MNTILQGDYTSFLQTKSIVRRGEGITPTEPHPMLFPFQRDITKWALRRGRACVFADCGMGKTFMQIEWAKQIPGDVLILAPLAVAQQTISEAAKLNTIVRYVRDGDDVQPGITITNYEMLEHFDPARFAGVVLDESSIIKHFEGKFRNMLISRFADTPFRLACTATPAPNDHMELGNHAEFVGAMTRTEMLSMFFVHDGGDTAKWRLKGHAEAEFWKWVCSWAVMIRKPSDLGYEDADFVLPPVTIEQIAIEHQNSGDFLFAMEAQTLQERIAARRDSIDLRVHRAYDLISSSWHTIPNITANGAEKIKISSAPKQRNGIKQTGSESACAPKLMPSPIERNGSKNKKNTTHEPQSDAADICGCDTRKSASKSWPIIETGGRIAQTLSETGICEPNTASRSSSTERCLPSNQADAPSAGVYKSDSTLTIATPLTELGDCSAAVAIMDSADSRMTRNGCDVLPSTSKEQWIVWCGLNSEQDALADLLGDECISIYGSLSPEEKNERYRRFANGEARVLITKVSMFGFGVNMQFCRNTVFLGLSDSWESYYQAVRRIWRFGQKEPVNVYIITSTAEGQVVQNIKRKEADAALMASEMVKHMHSINEANIKGTAARTDAYSQDVAKGERFELHLGDCVEVLKKVESDSVGFSIFSPPFASLYTYSASDRDMGNVRNDDEFQEHFSFLIPELYRVLQPGRLVSFHCMDIPSMKSRDGMIGLKDFPAQLIQAFQNAGFIYHSRVVIWKDPLVEATRTKALGLMHKQLMKDSAMCRQGLPDYLITMRKPGENENPIAHPNGFERFIGLDEPKGQGPGSNPVYSHQVWRRYASPVWMDIDQTRTLQRESAREEKDERHICPLQLDVIERAIELWTNPGDTVLSPFAGIGSEGYVALMAGRRFIGAELKATYWKQAANNLQLAETETERDLFAEIA